ncbi:hypothetical protein [Phenylobacterium sp. J367]|uniref:hypothetical protein n=1 Tax=Phenylobacterium sp. J367 TaxID=2898435 RepID=UPI002151F9FB|nr:hypothetical protein [Phenylobacterium sp. J367]MCR5878199.1 hypothetical protein [Phenylobacterium sp. J367]
MQNLLPAVFVAWLLILAVWTLCFFVMMQALNHDTFTIFNVTILFAAPLLLLAWGALRIVFGARRRTATLVVLGAAAVAVGWVVAQPVLLPVAARLNFLRQKPAYEAVVAEFKAGRFGQARSGKSHGLVWARLDSMNAIDFQWSREPPTLFPTYFGLVYDEENCPERPAPPPTPVPPYDPDGADPPTFKHAGLLGERFHLQGHYCLMFFQS